MSDFGMLPFVIVVLLVAGIRVYAARSKRRVVPPLSSPMPFDDFSWLLPPRTLVDPTAWDRYWQDQLSHAAESTQAFMYLFCEDGDLVDAMRENGLKTILCVGNGISQEPRALAWAGFTVTALDLSPFSTEVAKGTEAPDDLLAGLVGGRSPDSGGSVEFIAGDLCDAACCPGPYDVIIDRRTLQLYPDDQRGAAMQAVAKRLASPGIFFSHSHHGAWKPPASPLHFTEPWFVAEKWPIWRRREASLPGRVAWLQTTTG